MSPRPKDVLDFSAEQLVMVSDAYWEAFKDREKRNALPPEDRYCEYLGMAVAAISREGTSQTLAVFGPNGSLMASDNTEYRRSIEPRYGYAGGLNTLGVASAQAALLEKPWAPV